MSAPSAPEVTFTIPAGAKIKPKQLYHKRGGGMETGDVKTFFSETESVNVSYKEIFERAQKIAHSSGFIADTTKTIIVLSGHPYNLETPPATASDIERFQNLLSDLSEPYVFPVVAKERSADASIARTGAAVPPPVTSSSTPASRVAPPALPSKGK